VELYASGSYLAWEVVDRGRECNLGYLTAPGEIPVNRKPVYEEMMAEPRPGRPPMIADVLH
jgi:hypothetical protein